MSVKSLTLLQRSQVSVVYECGVVWCGMYWLSC